MKNANYRWKDQRQASIPSRDGWGSREWRRYEARQNRKNGIDTDPSTFAAGDIAVWSVGLFVVGCALVGVFCGPWWCKLICLVWLLTHIHIEKD